MKEIRYTIPLPPITKKNSMQIIQIHGRPRLIPSKQYRKYEKEAAPYLAGGETLSGRYNVKTVFYMPTRRRVDLSNLIEAAHDVMVKHGVLEDDNSKIIVSVDGSRVRYDKERPRTEIIITEAEEDDCCT